MHTWEYKISKCQQSMEGCLKVLSLLANGGLVDFFFVVADMDRAIVHRLRFYFLFYFIYDFRRHILSKTLIFNNHINFYMGCNKYIYLKTSMSK